MIANIITVLNFCSGILSLIFILNGDLFYSHTYVIYYCFISSLLFDFLDGFIARSFYKSSDFGRELDSFADIISFGLVPGVIIFRILNDNNKYGILVNLLLCIVIPICSLIRLTKFNIYNSKKSWFIGLPTPINTMFYMGILNLYVNNILNFSFKLLVLYEFIIIVISLLLISNIPFFSLKIKFNYLKNNIYKYLFLIISLFTYFIFNYYSLIIIFLNYILLSLLYRKNIINEFK